MTGKSPGRFIDPSVKPSSQKYSIFRKRKSVHRFAVPSQPEGRLAIVTDAGRDAVDAEAPITNGTEADGEVVWS